MTAELIEPRESGWLTAEPWDPEQIALELWTLTAEPALRQRMVEAARSRIEACTWERAAEQTLAVFREV